MSMRTSESREYAHNNACYHTFNWKKKFITDAEDINILTGQHMAMLSSSS